MLLKKLLNSRPKIFDRKFNIDGLEYSMQVIETPSGNLYAIDTDMEKKLGKGAYGVVWTAYRVLNKSKWWQEDKLELEIDKKTQAPKKYAVKILTTEYRDQEEEKAKKKIEEQIETEKREIVRESEMMGRYYQAEKPVIVQRRKKCNITDKYYLENKYYLVSEFIPGKSLISDEGVIHPDLHKLTFSQRINLITQIVMQFNLMHHETPTTGPVIVHRDVKGSNIKVDIQLSPEEIAEKVAGYVLDFGTAKELRHEDQKEKTGLIGSPHNIPPEMVNKTRESRVSFSRPETGEVGTKSDIRGLAPIIMLILGARSPYGVYDRNAASIFKYSKEEKPKMNITALQRYLDSGFDPAGFLSAMNGLPSPQVQELLIKFVKKMARFDYDARASSDEALEFFNTLSALCKNMASPYENIYLAKLIFAAKSSLSHQAIAQLDFASHPKVCEIIVNLDTEGRLDSDRLHVLQNFFKKEKTLIEFLKKAKVCLPLLPGFSEQDLISEAISLYGFKEVANLKKEDLSLVQKRFLRENHTYIMDEYKKSLVKPEFYADFSTRRRIGFLHNMAKGFEKDLFEAESVRVCLNKDNVSTQDQLKQEFFTRMRRFS